MAPKAGPPGGFADAPLLPSDDEGDSDFHASGEEYESLSEDGSASGGDNSGDEATRAEGAKALKKGGRARKRRKTGKHDAAEDQEAKKPAEPTMSKDEVDDLWASFNAPVDASVKPAAASTASTTAPEVKKPPTSFKPELKAREKVTIPITYRFAGQLVTQDKEVWDDSPEAVDYFARKAREGPAAIAAAAPPGMKKDSSLDALFGPEDDQPVASSSSASTSGPVPPPAAAPPKRPRPGGGGLAALSASLSKKPQKLNTLEKSKLDWGSHVAKEGIQEDLTKARKSGYLDKMDFLQRTEDKKAEEEEKRRKEEREKRRLAGGM